MTPFPRRLHQAGSRRYDLGQSYAGLRIWRRGQSPRIPWRTKWLVSWFRNRSDPSLAGMYVGLVTTVEDALETADIFVTTTGNKDIISRTHQQNERPGYRLQHRSFDNEIKWLNWRRWRSDRKSSRTTAFRRSGQSSPSPTVEALPCRRAFDQPWFC